ncbi:hypothetical protein ACFPM7_15440 [Actinokineospora guangxiensis]|uniref:Uncharacterized protein n=1 Tax=Actinokineospora guangxiensis TaxID=1490288 RepID=A0ABW0EQV1_9PSEU
MSVIATWTSEFSDHSAKITSLSDLDQAARPALLRTQLSEQAWAATWLGAGPVIEAGIAQLVGQLRSTD